MSRFLLPNGLTLLLEPDPEAQTVAAGYFVNTGARDELSSEMGVSHFLEHLMFKGSEELDAVTLNERLDDLGGYSNAFTSEEATVYHAAALPERAAELLGTLTHLMRPALRPGDIEPERQVILEEIAMYADQPAAQVIDVLRGIYWGGHPLGHQTLGTVATVSALSAEQLRRNFLERYGAGNVTLAVVGAFDESQIRRWATQELSAWPAGSSLAGKAEAAGVALPANPNRIQRIRDDRLSRVQVALDMPGLSTRHPLREAAAILADLIGGENGALYWALVDTGLCDSADLAHLDYRDAGVFEGGFSCDPERLDTALDTFGQILRDAEALITETSVRRAAKKAAVSTLLRAETPQGRLFTLGMEYLAVGQVRASAELARRYAEVTPEQLREVLKLCPLQSVTGVLLGPLAQDGSSSLVSS